MKVRLIAKTQDAAKVIAIAGRTCYTKLSIDELEKNITEDEIRKMLVKLRDSNHLSPFEHVSFTFAVEGISRSTSHQLVRHRIASYSQRSQRYVTQNEPFTYDTPEAVLEALAKTDNPDQFGCIMSEAQSNYAKLIELGVPAEDARELLPNACHTQLIFTMNARELYNVIAHRTCVRAQKPIRLMFTEITRILKADEPLIFEKLGPNCSQLGYCPESNLSCGRYPTISQLTKDYSKDKLEV